MIPRRSPKRSAAARALLGPGLAGLMFSGCFLGDAADGLPCEQDEDCGIGVSCLADSSDSNVKCCGGSCLAPGSGTGVVPTTSSEVGTSSGTTASETTGVDDLCGNGVFDEDMGELCDASAPDGPPCGAGCSLCGNDNLDAGEGCDNAGNPNCGMDCQYVSLCGNGSLDAGEVCDVWGLPPGEECDSCTEWTAFRWVADGSPAGFCENEDDDCTRWARDEFTGVWGSGEYFHNGDAWAGPAVWPEAILRSGRIPFPSLEAGDVVRVELGHAHSLNFEEPGNGADRFVDYVELALEPAAEDADDFWDFPLGDVLIACVDGKNDTIIGAGCTTATEEDYCEPGLRRGAGVLSAEGGVPTYTYSVPEGGSDAGARRLRFGLRYDCVNLANGNLERPPADAWTISSVTVTVSKR
ncbi:MAG: hypothetical protein ACRBN8_00560 [Nannocystales bacterium]